MTPLAARLAKRGLIERSAGDGRTFELALTPQGEALVKQVREQVDLHEAAVTARIPPEHRPHLLPALMALWGGSNTD
jgi:DNA-binding MarR family transcriptional regulator